MSDGAEVSLGLAGALLPRAGELNGKRGARSVERAPLGVVEDLAGRVVVLAALEVHRDYAVLMPPSGAVLGRSAPRARSR